MKSLNSIIIKNSIRFEKAHSEKKNLLIFTYGFVYTFLIVIMILASYFVTSKLKIINQEYTFVSILLLLNLIVLFEKSIFESLNVLYLSKDLKILLKMPINIRELIHAKLNNEFISEYIMEFIMLAIPIIVYGIYTKVTILFYIYALIVLIFLPVIPMSITSVILALVMRFTNKIKDKRKTTYITLILTLGILGVFLASFNNMHDLAINSFQNALLKTNGIAIKLGEIFKIFKILNDIFLEYNTIYGLKCVIIYILTSIVTYVICIEIISKIYLKGAIGVAINSEKRVVNKNNVDISIKDVRKKNKYISYVLKDLKLLLRTPLFLIQCIIVPSVYPFAIFFVLSLVAKYIMGISAVLLDLLYKSMLTSYGMAIFLAIANIMYIRNFASIIAISMEAKSNIITKSLPIDLYTQFKLKNVIGITINLISGFVIAVCYYICTNSIIYASLMFVLLFVLNLICEKVKLIIDLRNPRINWENEYIMMKQNANVMYELCYALMLTVMFFLISVIVKEAMIYYCILLGITVIINVFLNHYVKYNVDKVYSKIY